MNKQLCLAFFTRTIGCFVLNVTPSTSQRQFAADKNPGHSRYANGFVLRLRGGVQGPHMEVAIKTQRRARMLTARNFENGGAKELIEEVMSIEKYPETLDPVPIQWPYPFDIKEEAEEFAHLMIMPQFNENRVVYNPVGGNAAALRGFGLAGMAVEPVRKWPYAIPAVTGHRCWRNMTFNGVKVYKRPQASAVRTSCKTSWKEKMEVKERKAALRAVVAELTQRGRDALEQERLRLQSRRRVRLENRAKAVQYEMVTNPKTIAKMSKKEASGSNASGQGLVPAAPAMKQRRKLKTFPSPGQAPLPAPPASAGKAGNKAAAAAAAAAAGTGTGKKTAKEFNDKLRAEIHRLSRLTHPARS